MCLPSTPAVCTRQTTYDYVTNKTNQRISQALARRNNARAAASSAYPPPPAGHALDAPGGGGWAGHAHGIPDWGGVEMTATTGPDGHTGGGAMREESSGEAEGREGADGQAASSVKRLAAAAAAAASGSRADASAATPAATTTTATATVAGGSAGGVSTSATPTAGSSALPPMRGSGRMAAVLKRMGADAPPVAPPADNGVVVVQTDASPAGAVEVGTGGSSPVSAVGTGVPAPASGGSGDLSPGGPATTGGASDGSAPSFISVVVPPAHASLAGASEMEFEYDGSHGGVHASGGSRRRSSAGEGGDVGAHGAGTTTDASAPGRPPVDSAVDADSVVVTAEGSAGAQDARFDRANARSEAL